LNALVRARSRERRLMLSQIEHVLGVIALALSVAGIAYALAAATVIRRIAAGPAARAARPASLLKPLHGMEPELAANLKSFLDQDYGAPFQMVFGVQDPDDPALEIVRRLKADHPDADIEIVVDGPLHGPNRKVSNLINMAAKARHELLVLSDADMRAPRDYLERIAAAAGQNGVGAVTCYYFGQARAGYWSRLAAMGISYGFLPNVAIGVALGLAHPCMGSTIALNRNVLEEIGGFQAFVNSLADDYEIGHAVRSKGHKVVLPDFALAHGCDEQSLRALFAHELRWAVTIRCMDPLGHVGSVVTHPLAWAVIGTVLLGVPAYGLSILAAAAAARLWLIRSVDRTVGVSSGPWQGLLLRDILSFGVFACSLFARRVDWRGSSFTISSNGRLSPA
jgi:ceramide glucosyltransferase